MGIKTHHEKSFILGDVQLYTVFSVAVIDRITSSSLHTHSQYELFAFSDGAGYLDLGYKQIPFKKGSIVLVAPNTEHSIVCSKDSPPMAMTVFFNFKKAVESKRHSTERLFCLFNALIPKEGNSIVLNDKFFFDFITSLTSQPKTVPDLDSMLISNMIEGLFLHIIRKLAHDTSAKNNTPINLYTSSVTNDVMLAKCIENHISSMSCTLASLAARLNMCQRNTQKILRKIYGKSFSEMQAEKRLGVAIQLMKSTELTLSDIAKQVCYNQYPSFRKAFITKFGMSPSEYRATLKKDGEAV